MGIQNYPALVLNADFRPLSYFPLSLWAWQDTVKAVFLDRVNVVSEYEKTVSSPSWEMRLPSVISLKEYVPMARRPAFTRYNVFLRDRFTCQYCRQPSPAEELTFDHVIPRSRGGRTSWDNVVAACTGCNLQKGNRMPRESGIVPVRKPQEPSNFELQENGRAFPPNFLHESWRDFLYWDTELEIA
ncbi:MAG: HNH endonuclease [Rhodospirillales bacterium]|jgi:5-methylcytosine-specific restriction endonuclease McrA